MERQRMTFGNWVDAVFSSVIASICAFGVYQISSMKSELSQVNSHIATIIERTTNQETRLDSLESRVIYLERKGKK